MKRKSNARRNAFTLIEVVVVIVILVMLASTGLTLLSVGILGEYMMHILDETKKMPHYVLRQKETDNKLEKETS